MKVVVLSMIL